VRGGLLGNASIENCKALVRAVIRSLAEGDADLALWEHLDMQSPLYASAMQLPSFVMRGHCHKLSDHWFLNHPKNLEAFFRSLGRSQRSKLQRKYKKFQNSFAGKIQVRSFQTAAELGEAIRDMEEIARKSVKRQLGLGFFDTPGTHEQLLVEAAQGWLRIYILYVEGKPVSFWKGTLYEHCLQADHVGFDSAWSEFSPGIFLFLNIIESLRNSEVEAVDFGTGNGQFYQCSDFRPQTQYATVEHAAHFDTLRNPADPGDPFLERAAESCLESSQSGVRANLDGAMQ
jgi:CelD/BcsL family acetyltransferase involved in cellulose biosynthesis